MAQYSVKTSVFSPEAAVSQQQYYQVDSLTDQGEDRIVVDSKGNIYVGMWYSVSGTSAYGFNVRMSTDHGNTWTNVFNVSASHSGLGMTLAVDSQDRIYIMTQENGVLNLYYGSGSSWSSATTMFHNTALGSGSANGISFYIDPSNDNNLYVAVIDNNGYLSISVSLDRGSTWTDHKNITGSGRSEPNLVLNPGSNNIALYCNDRSSAPDNYIECYEESGRGGTWSIKATWNSGNTSSAFQNGRALKVGNYVHLFWNQSAYYLEHLYTADGLTWYNGTSSVTIAAGGQINSFSAQQIVTTSGSLYAVTAGVSGDGTIFVYYQINDGLSNAQRIHLKTSTDGVNWSADQVVEDSGTTQSDLYPVVAKNIRGYFVSGASDRLPFIYHDAAANCVPFTGAWSPQNTPPNAPTFSYISSNGSTLNGRPKMFFNVSDPDSGNTIQNMEFQVSSSSTFSTITWDGQYGSDSGYGNSVASAFSGLPTTTNTSSRVSVTPQSSWAPSSLGVGTWYVRARCKDNNGAWSTWSATQQFTVAAAPWSDTPNGYGMKAQWMNDLTTVINNGELFRGWNAFSMFNIDTTWDIQPWHVAIRRALLKVHGDFITGQYQTYNSNTGLSPLGTIDQLTGGWFSGTTNDFSFFGSSATPTSKVDSSQHFLGGCCISATSTYAGSQDMSIYTFNKPAAVTAGQTYSQEIWCMAPAGRTIEIQGAWQNPQGTRVTAGDGTTVRPVIQVSATGGWQRITQVFTIPSGVTYAETEVKITNAQQNDTLYLQMIPMYAGNAWTFDRMGQDIIDIRNACATVV